MNKEQQVPKWNVCIYCGLPMMYRNNTRCPNGCIDRSAEWKEIRLLRNEMKQHISIKNEL